MKKDSKERMRQKGIEKDQYILKGEKGNNKKIRKKDLRKRKRGERNGSN